MLSEVRRLWRMGLTPERLGREQWRRQARAVMEPVVVSAPSRPPRERLMTVDAYRAITARNRASATPAELEQAEADAPRECEQCDGARFLLVRGPGERLSKPVPCDCLPLGARAALAGIPPRYQKATLESFNPLPEKSRAREWCMNWDGRKSVVLVGAQWGAGKTHLGVGLLLTALAQGKPARFVHVPSFLEDVKARFDGSGEHAQAYADRIASEPLMMLDDLGQERATDWTRGQLRWLFERRWAHQLTTIVTTNLESEAALADFVGGAVASRLREAKWLRVAGKDMRGE